MKKYKILSNESFEDVDSNVMDEILKLKTYGKDLVSSPEKWSLYLRNYLVLTHQPSKVEGGRLSEMEILINRYSMFSKFYFGYSQNIGFDAGIEQQIQLIIEEIDSKVNDFDWNIIKEIDDNLDN